MVILFFDVFSCMKNIWLCGGTVMGNRSAGMKKIPGNQI